MNRGVLSVGLILAASVGNAQNYTPGSGGGLTTAGTGLTVATTGTVSLTTPVSVANGGNGTASPSLVSGTGATVSGSWPNQTISATGGGGSPGGTTNSIQTNNGSGGFTAGPVNRFGGADAATATLQTIVTQGIVSGTSNVAGGTLTWQASNGTGTGGSGSLAIQTAPAGTAGTGPDTLSTVFTFGPTFNTSSTPLLVNSTATVAAVAGLTFEGTVAPPAQTNGGAAMGVTTGNGLIIVCAGSTNDCVIQNSDGVNACVFPHVTRGFTCTGTIAAATLSATTSATLAAASLTGTTNIATAGAGAVNLLTGASTGTLHVMDGTGTGVIVIGNSTHTGNTQLAGLASSSAAQTGTLCIGTGNVISFDTTTTCLLSDMDLKEYIRRDDIHGLAEVMALRPISYDVKASTSPVLHALGRQVGLGAQEVVKVDPRLVSLYASGPKKGKPSGVRYEQLTAVLIAAIQEQQAEIEADHAEIAALKHQLASH